MNIISNNPGMIISKNAANHNAIVGRTLMQLNFGGGENKLEMMGIIKKDNMQGGGPKTLMNMDGSGINVTGREPKSKVSHNQI